MDPSKLNMKRRWVAAATFDLYMSISTVDSCPTGIEIEGWVAQGCGSKDECVKMRISPQLDGLQYRAKAHLRRVMACVLFIWYREQKVLAWVDTHRDEGSRSVLKPSTFL